MNGWFAATVRKQAASREIIATDLKAKGNVTEWPKVLPC